MVDVFSLVKAVEIQRLYIDKYNTIVLKCSHTTVHGHPFVPYLITTTS